MQFGQKIGKITVGKPLPISQFHGKFVKLFEFVDKSAKVSKKFRQIDEFLTKNVDFPHESISLFFALLR